MLTTHGGISCGSTPDNWPTVMDAFWPHHFCQGIAEKMVAKTMTKSLRFCLVTFCSACWIIYGDEGEDSMQTKDEKKIMQNKITSWQKQKTISPAVSSGKICAVMCLHI